MAAGMESCAKPTVRVNNSTRRRVAAPAGGAVGRAAEGSLGTSDAAAPGGGVPALLARGAGAGAGLGWNGATVCGGRALGCQSEQPRAKQPSGTRHEAGRRPRRKRIMCRANHTGSPRDNPLLEPV
jgi:hypothetical protein